MEVRPGYKKTEVGVIPEDWGQDRICNHASITTGAKDTKDKIDDGKYPFFVRSPIVERINSYSFDGEAVLTAGDGVGTGKVFHYINGKFDFHQRVYRISDFSKDLDGYFFYLYFSTHFYNRIMSMTAKSSVDSVRMEMIADMMIPLPPLPEQRTIAEVLSDVDALVDALERLIAKKRAIKQGAMQELLRPKVGWVEKHLGDVASFHKGKGLAKSELDPFGTELCIHYGELFTKYPESIKRVRSRTNTRTGVFRSLANDVLMPTSDVTPNGLATASCILQDQVILGGDILVIRAPRDQLNGSFLSYMIRFSRDQVLQLVTGTTVYHLYGSDMKKFKFPMPGIEQQEAIVRTLDDMDAEIAALEARREKTRALKQGMMQELLTGRTRLV